MVQQPARFINLRLFFETENKGVVSGAELSLPETALEVEGAPETTGRA